MSDPRLILHVIHRLDVGGMENGLVNLINGMPQDRYRHAIVCLKDYTDFSSRLRDVAMKAITSGQLEGQTLQEAVSETRNSFSKLPESFVSVLPDTGISNYAEMKEQNIVTFELPEFSTEIRILDEFNRTFTGENGPDINKIDNIIENITAKNGPIDETIKQMQG